MTTKTNRNSFLCHISKARWSTFVISTLFALMFFFLRALPMFAADIQIYQGKLLFADKTVHNLSLRYPVLIIDGEYYFPLTSEFSASVGLEVLQVDAASTHATGLLLSNGGGVAIKNTRTYHPLSESMLGPTIDIEQIAPFIAPVILDDTLLSTTRPVYHVLDTVYLCFDDIRRFTVTSKKLLRTGLQEQSAKLPERFSVFDLLQASDYVRDQGSTLNCWAYAANSMLELKIGLTEGKIVDFSEDHLVANCPVPSDPRSGGNWRGSAAYLTRGIGPVLENESTETRTQYIVKAYEEIKGIDRIKQAVFENGSVLTAIYYGANRHKYYNNETFAYYHNNPKQNATHELLIVGWDDQYPKENFIEQPPIDGAFIAMNSFGSLFGNGGLFYISYADRFMSKSAYSISAYRKIEWNGEESLRVLGRGDTGVTHYETLHNRASDVYAIIKIRADERNRGRLHSLGIFSGSEAVVTAYYSKNFPKKLDELTLLGETYFAEAGFQTLETLLPVQIQDECYIVLKYNSKARFVVPVEAPYPGIDYEIIGEEGTSFLAYEERRILYPTPLETFKPNGSIVIRLYLQ